MAPQNVSPERGVGVGASPVLEATGTGHQLRLKEGLALHLYCSQPPCEVSPWPTLFTLFNITSS